VSSAREYNTSHDLAIKAADWAMKTDPACAAAHQRRIAAKEALALASRQETDAAHTAHEAANAEWCRLTHQVFNRVMAEAGFPQQKADAA
jgi:hypothetical protein